MNAGVGTIGKIDQAAVVDLDEVGLDRGLAVILTVDRYDEALAALRDAGVHAVSEDAIIIRIIDEPGALARIARRFHDAGIPLRSVRIIRRNAGSGLVALSTERTEQALDLVRDELVS